jgi:hypothetical protein
MGRRGHRGAALAMMALLALGGAARAQDKAPLNGAYCAPAPGTKLLYTNRAYLILPPPPNAPPLLYSYSIIGTERKVERQGQMLFDDGTDRWAFETNPEGLSRFWPLKLQNKFDIERIDRGTRNHALVTFTVVGTESVDANRGKYRSWKIRRFDHMESGSTFEQFLWYAPDLCTLVKFTDSQQREVKLLRVLKPGDKDYNRPVARRGTSLYFTDKNEIVK